MKALLTVVGISCTAMCLVVAMIIDLISRYLPLIIAGAAVWVLIKVISWSTRYFYSRRHGVDGQPADPTVLVAFDVPSYVRAVQAGDRRGPRERDEAYRRAVVADRRSDAPFERALNCRRQGRGHGY